ncbi:hypothetical protein B0H14DRAFT_2587729 [Mycena olivaceomarginata]|nr:hypothetical protein B0H14DRAFT_2587729 [Mycena olivaceomarginata]
MAMLSGTLSPEAPPVPRLVSLPCSRGFRSSWPKLRRRWRRRHRSLTKSVDHPKMLQKFRCGRYGRNWARIRNGGTRFGPRCRDLRRLNWDASWKSQRSEKLSKAYNAGVRHLIPSFRYRYVQIEEFPETRRFAGQWAIDSTVKQFWDNHKNYRNCVNDETTYRGRRATARRAGRAQSPGTASRTSSSPHRTSNISRSRSNHSPTPGPSHRHQRHRSPCRLPSTDSKNEHGQDRDKFINTSDSEAPHNEKVKGTRRRREACRPRQGASARR